MLSSSPTPQQMSPMVHHPTKSSSASLDTCPDNTIFSTPSFSRVPEPMVPSIPPSNAAVIADSDTPPIKLGLISPEHSSHPHSTTTSTGAVISPPPFSRVLEMMALLDFSHEAIVVTVTLPRNPGPISNKNDPTHVQ
ncbi:uncharacterized protein ARMOST_20364 [Armillaria ostoyae]|uniref:Uncharacterized protein n=1 Tax=Armillaria ostoyae TaxID=47428 RepID=A0A284S756_ARMOS|nr:uncharacterized protein ARMOST_20364 [Armillaria ostoyae]